MSGFSDVLGHDNIIEHFKSAIRMEKVSHAYILSGEAGTGKKMLSRLFSMALQCERGGEEPCMSCRSCKQSLSGNQPDIKWLVHEKPNSISVEEIREQINSDIQIKPYSSRYKIYIIDEAQKMTEAAQNALLKTIEEPPAYGILLLLTTNIDGLLPTILSRCVKLNLKPVPDMEIKKYLTEELQVAEDKADVAIAFAGGNLGKAVKLASSEHFLELKNEVLHLVKEINHLDTTQVMDAVKKVGAYKLELDDFMDLMLVWYRDILMYKVSKNIGALVFQDEYAEISSQAVNFSYNGLEEILMAISRVKDRLKANVNFDLTIELMLLTIKENYK